MKKLVVLLVLLSVLLTGCGQGETPTESNNVGNSHDTEETNQMAEFSDRTEDSEISGDFADNEDSSSGLMGSLANREENTSDEEDSSDAGNSLAPQGFVTNGQISFQELTVVDNDECTIRITGIDADNRWGYTLNVYVENKSSDKTYMFSVRDAAVNGVECYAFFATEVSPGKKANEEISIVDSNLDENGIIDFTDIELHFRVYDSNDWSADDVAVETVHVYPYGEENATVYVRETQDTDNVIVDNEYVTVIVTGYEYDDIWGYSANLFIVNKTDVNIMVSVDDASINGYMIDPYYATSVMPNKCTFSSVSWYESSLESNGITEVEEIEFSIRVYNYDDWRADDYVDEIVVLNP